MVSDILKHPVYVGENTGIYDRKLWNSGPDEYV